MEKKRRISALVKYIYLEYYSLRDEKGVDDLGSLDMIYKVVFGYS